MNHMPFTCQAERRRSCIRKKPQYWNGMDFLEISEYSSASSEKKPKLRIVFFNKLGPLAETIRKENVRIYGGTRIRDIEVERISLCIQEDPDRDDCILVYLNTYGDLSRYRVCLVQTDDSGQPIHDEDGEPRPLAGIDSVYACLPFTFRVCCPGELDCSTSSECPPLKRNEPDINYLAKDYASFRQLILDRLALIMPDWKERHAPDVGVALVEILAYVGDTLSYFQDAVATEAYLGTARQRISVRRHARLVDYTLHEGCNSRVWIHVQVSGMVNDLFPSEFFFITRFDDKPVTGRPLLSSELPDEASYLVFEPLVENTGEPVRWNENHNLIRIYTWGKDDCCLKKGITRVTLVDSLPSVTVQEMQPEIKTEDRIMSVSDTRPVPPSSRSRILDLKPGDFLLFEEVIGPGTGNPADADISHRHVVRLTSVRKIEDPLCDPPLPLLEVGWSEEDALPFPLCLSTIIPSDECRYVGDITIVRGNIILADHGRRVGEYLGEVQPGIRKITCDPSGFSDDDIIGSLPFYPVLHKIPLTYSKPLVPGTPASGLLDQDPRETLPSIRLFSRLGELTYETRKSWEDYLVDPTSVDKMSPDETTWFVQPDLVESDPYDHHFVVESDDGMNSHIRFGNGVCGGKPGAGTLFRAMYRTGNGKTGNIGAGAISHLVLYKRMIDGIVMKPTNPMPASGGTNPEPVEEARLRSPFYFRKNIRRAINEEDYAMLAKRDFPSKIQQAACVLRWTGSWYEAQVSLDQTGKSEADQDLADKVRNRLGLYRRIGHDLGVKGAQNVPIDLTLQICISPGYSASDVRSDLNDLLSNRLLPNGKSGFFHPDNLTFQEGISISRIIAVAGTVPGVENVVVTKLQRTWDPSGEAIVSGILPIGSYEIARMDNDPSNPENGVLTLEIQGEG